MHATIKKVCTTKKKMASSLLDHDMTDDVVSSDDESIEMLHGDSVLQDSTYTVDDLEELLAKFIVLQGGKDDLSSIERVLSQQGLLKCEKPRMRAPGIYWLFGKTMSGKTRFETYITKHSSN